MHNRNHRIRSGDTIEQVIFKMSEGNPGCIAFLSDLLGTHHPMAVLFILRFDILGLYGSKLYMLWNDCCDRSAIKVIEVLEKNMAGEISDIEIVEHVSGTYGTPFDFISRKEETHE